jgi:hypothetical protein
MKTSSKILFAVGGGFALPVIFIAAAILVITFPFSDEEN